MTLKWVTFFEKRLVLKNQCKLQSCLLIMLFPFHFISLYQKRKKNPFHLRNRIEVLSRSYFKRNFLSVHNSEPIGTPKHRYLRTHYCTADPELTPKCVPMFQEVLNIGKLSQKFWNLQLCSSMFLCPQIVNYFLDSVSIYQIESSYFSPRWLWCRTNTCNTKNNVHVNSSSLCCL